VGPANVRTNQPTDWSNRIITAWQKSVTGILETAQLLIEAKAALPHGAFTKMIDEELPFGPDTAQKLMKIGKHKRLTNTAMLRVLPPSYAVLHELTKLDDIKAFAVACVYATPACVTPYGSRRHKKEGQTVRDSRPDPQEK
jgi:hypothetical protein